MKINRLAVILPLVVFMSVSGFAQQADSSSTKLLQKLAGTWKVESATGKKLTMATAPMGNPTAIRFTKDAKYILLNNDVKIDSGSFNTNESQASIYLQSVADKDHLQEWKVTLKSIDAMTLIGKKGSKSEGAKYVCVRQK